MQHCDRLVPPSICRVHQICEVRYGVVIVKRSIAQLFQQTRLQLDRHLLELDNCNVVTLLERLAEPRQPSLFLLLDLIGCLVYALFE